MIVIQYFFRTLSFIVASIILIPMCLLMYTLIGIFTLINNFMYHNFTTYKIDDDKLELVSTMIGVPFYFVDKFSIVLKILTLIITPIISIFVNTFSSCRTIRF